MRSAPFSRSRVRETARDGGLALQRASPRADFVVEARMGAMECEDIGIGDVVQLRSGGPRMTVHGVSVDKIDATWWRGSSIQAGSFAPETIVVIEAKDSGPSTKKR
jgi:uncharacterized protein YodC (DUF2158 family)